MELFIYQEANYYLLKTNSIYCCRFCFSKEIDRKFGNDCTYEKLWAIEIAVKLVDNA